MTYMTLPTAPIYVGESFTLTIKVSTGTNELYVSNFAVNFNTDYLEYNSFSSSAVFLASANLASAGSVEVLFLSPAGGVTRAETKVGRRKLKSWKPALIIAPDFSDCDQCLINCAQALLTMATCAPLHEGHRHLSRRDDLQDEELHPRGRHRGCV